MLPARMSFYRLLEPAVRPLKRLGRALLWVAVALAPALPAAAQTARPWMHGDVGLAWSQGFRGKGTTVTVIDDFRSKSTLTGILAGKSERRTHGGWTALEVQLIAPSAQVVQKDWLTSKTRISLKKGLNVVNLSYGLQVRAGSTVRLAAQEDSVVTAARLGLAVVVKAAGNDAVPMGSANRGGMVDQLALSLAGAPGTVFVGALTAHGSTAAPAAIAGYSNTAGTDPAFQDRYLVVGVPSASMGLAGTSFAAPAVSGYSAILGSKFTSASPTQIADRLLQTARQDTVQGYDPTIHGRGEASLSRALAPAAIN